MDFDSFKTSMLENGPKRLVSMIFLKEFILIYNKNTAIENFPRTSTLFKL